MTRFIQQRIMPLVSRFIPAAWCPACGNVAPIQNKPQSLSLKDGHKIKEKEKSKRKTNKKQIKSA